MIRFPRLVLIGLVAAACGGDEAADDTARDLSLAPAESVATLNDAPPAQSQPQPRAQTAAPRQTTPRPSAPSAPSLAVGTSFMIHAIDTLTSRHNKRGDTVRAVLLEPVRDARGREVIPANAVFLGTITDIAPAESPGGQGRMVITYDRVDVGGTMHRIGTVTDSAGTRMKGRGVTAGDAAKVGAGTVVGAIAGRVIGGNKTGTAVGAAVGTAAGVGIAAATRDIDIILDAGAPIFVTVNRAFSRS